MLGRLVEWSVRNVFLVLLATLFLIGGGLSIEVIRKVGLKPLVLGIILWAVISVASLAVILLL